MALLESIGIGSVLGSIGQAVIGSRGGGGGFSTLRDILAAAQAAQAQPDEPPEQEPDAGVPVDVVAAPILQPTIFAIQRAVVVEWLADNFDRPAAEVDRDPLLQDEIAELTECMIVQGRSPSLGDVEQCADLIADGQFTATVLEFGFGLPGLLRGPARRGPVRTPPGQTPGVIRPRDRPSPTTPELEPLPGEPGQQPSRLPPLFPDPMPEIDFPPLGEPQPTLPDLVEIELLPVRLPSRERLPAPGRPSPPVVQPAPPATEPAPEVLPQPRPAPAPPPAPLPGTAVPPAVIGAVTGAGISVIARGRPGARATDSVPLPEQPSLPEPNPVPQLQETRLRTRIDECAPCEKEAPEEPREVCQRGLYQEFVLDSEFTPWAEYDCITGEWIRDL